MMSEERRRYFRINETIGLTIQKLDPSSSEYMASEKLTPSVLERISEHDEEILHLLDDLAVESPQVAKLIRLLNQKIERASGLMAVKGDLLDRIAHKIQEVNISACGLAFSHEEFLDVGARLKLELTLHPSDTKILTDAIVICCECASEHKDTYYCRVDFLGMPMPAQEALIQHIVRCQGSQLKSRHNDYI